MKKYFTLIFSLLLVKNVFSQNQDGIKNMQESTDFIIDFDSKFIPPSDSAKED